MRSNAASKLLAFITRPCIKNGGYSWPSTRRKAGSQTSRNGTTKLVIVFVPVRLSLNEEALAGFSSTLAVEVSVRQAEITASGILFAVDLLQLTDDYLTTHRGAGSKLRARSASQPVNAFFRPRFFVPFSCRQIKNRNLLNNEAAPIRSLVVQFAANAKMPTIMMTTDAGNGGFQLQASEAAEPLAREHAALEMHQLLQFLSPRAVWCLQLMCLTEQRYVDEVENDEEGVAEEVLNDARMAEAPRPATSLRRTAVSTSTSEMPSQIVRPRTRTGRPLSGVLRPGTEMGRCESLDKAVRTARTAMTARPVTSMVGRHLRLGTAAMMSDAASGHLNISRLNFAKYAQHPTLSKVLFEYIFYHENDVRNAMQMATRAMEFNQNNSWYWKVQMGKCYRRLGMYREAEKQLMSAYEQQPIIDTALLLCKVYASVDQPLNAIKFLDRCLSDFVEDTSLLLCLARLYDGIGETDMSQKMYKRLLREDCTSVESIACIATHHFYSDQPEIALRYFRRILQMGFSSAETFANIGLCCFYAQHNDLALKCIHMALDLAEDDEILAHLWYNVGHIAMALGDVTWASQCISVCLALNNSYVEAWCNLGVIAMHKKMLDEAKSYFATAIRCGNYTFEPFYNMAYVTYKLGQYAESFRAVKESLRLFPEHQPSKQLEERLTDLFLKV